MAGWLRGLCLLTLTLVLLAPQSAAFADCGPGFEATFIRQGGSGIWDSRGASMRNNVRDAALAPFCYDPDGYPPHRHSTLAINQYPSAFELVEIGWRKEATPGEPIYSGFWKWFVNGSDFGDGLFTTTCCGWRRFKEYKLPGTSVIWQFRYDNNNDGIFETSVGQVETFGLLNGMASGETGRRGGAGTNAYDHYHDLKRTTSTSGDVGWTAWSGNTWWKGCIPDVTPAYKWDWMSQSEYQIIGGTPCHP